MEPGSIVQRSASCWGGLGHYRSHGRSIRKSESRPGLFQDGYAGNAQGSGRGRSGALKMITVTTSRSSVKMPLAGFVTALSKVLPAEYGSK